MHFAKYRVNGVVCLVGAIDKNINQSEFAKMQCDYHHGIGGDLITFFTSKAENPFDYYITTYDKCGYIVPSDVNSFFAVASHIFGKRVYTENTKIRQLHVRTYNYLSDHSVIIEKQNNDYIRVYIRCLSEQYVCYPSLPRCYDNYRSRFNKRYAAVYKNDLVNLVAEIQKYNDLEELASKLQDVYSEYNRSLYPSLVVRGIKDGKSTMSVRTYMGNLSQGIFSTSGVGIAASYAMLNDGELGIDPMRMELETNTGFTMPIWYQDGHIALECKPELITTMLVNNPNDKNTSIINQLSKKCELATK